MRRLLEARDRGSAYPLLTDGDGNVTEGSGYNIVLIKDRVLYTPDRGVLEGVTRKTVMELAKALGLEVRLEVVPVEAVYNCDELLIVTTAGGVMPITELDGAPVGDGQVGPLTKALFKGYWDAHYDEQLSFTIDYAAPTAAAAQ